MPQILPSLLDRESIFLRLSLRLWNRLIFQLISSDLERRKTKFSESDIDGLNCFLSLVDNKTIDFNFHDHFAYF